MVRFIRDYRGQYLRLTDERLEHVVRQHPEAARLGVLAIEELVLPPVLEKPPPVSRLPSHSRWRTTVDHPEIRKRPGPLTPAA